jgi:hypothetical protein
MMQGIEPFSDPSPMTFGGRMSLRAVKVFREILKDSWINLRIRRPFDSTGPGKMLTSGNTTKANTNDETMNVVKAKPVARIRHTRNSPSRGECSAVGIHPSGDVPDDSSLDAARMALLFC